MKILHVLVLLLIYALAGCSQQADKEKSDGKVAAVVNGVEITKRQIEYQYRRSAVAGISPQESANLKRGVLNNLIQLELLAEKARSMKLDQSMDYALERYSCEKKSLAALAKNELTRKKSSVSSEEADAFVHKNPALFAKRMVYTYDNFLIYGADNNFLESLDAMIEKGADIEQCIEQLKAKNISFVRKLEMQPSEKIGHKIRSVLNGLKPEVPQIVAFPKKVSVILVLHQTHPAPLEGLLAKRAAILWLSNAREQALMTQEMQSLIDNATITYFDEYLKEKEGDKALARLPAPNKTRANKNFFIKGFFAVTFFFSFVLGVMVLTAGVRILYDKSWLPRLGRTNKVPVKRENGKGSYAVRYSPPTYRRVHLFSLLTLNLVAIITDLLLINTVISPLALFACMVLGTLTGIVASRLYQAKRFATWRRKKYLSFANILTAFVLAGSLLIIYFRIY